MYKKFLMLIIIIIANSCDTQINKNSIDSEPEYILSLIDTTSIIHELVKNNSSELDYKGANIEIESLNYYYFKELNHEIYFINLRTKIQYKEWYSQSNRILGIALKTKHDHITF